MRALARIAVTAISSETREEIGLTSLTDLTNFAPGLTFAVATDLGVTSSFTGVIESLEEKGGNKEFVKVSIKAKQWESIASYS